MLPTTRHRWGISSKEVVLAGRNDTEMGPANSLHALAQYSEYNEDLILELNLGPPVLWGTIECSSLFLLDAVPHV